MAISTARSLTQRGDPVQSRFVLAPDQSHGDLGAKGEFERAIADATEAIGLAKAGTPANIMTPPGSVLFSVFIDRALAYEANGDYEHAKQDFGATREGVASDAGSKANQTTVRQSLLSDPVAPSPPRAPLSGETQAAISTPPPAASAGTTAGTRVALVIGNGAYANIWALPNPPNDARSVAKSPRTWVDRAAMQKNDPRFPARGGARARSRWSITPATAFRSTAATISYRRTCGRRPAAI